MHNKASSKIKRASLNHTYRLVWSDAKQMFIPVAEITPGKGKRKGGIVGAVAALMMGFGGIAHALDPGTLPTGANITHGQAQIQQNANVMNIHQTTDKLITHWNSFNIGQDATVNFHQPNSNSAALNRVVENNPSQILGNLNANGNVYLVNPSGILFGHNAQVDVGGLIASTLDISDQDFINGDLNFKNLGFSDGDIQNLGHIRANGGVVALIANRVSNQGTIEANNGNLAMAAGDIVTLDFNGDGLMTVKVEQGVLDALAENGGLIQADGGFVIMTTQAQNDIYKSVVNNDGIIQARTLQADKSGRIMLMGGMSQGQVIASGTLDASAPTTGDGGFIETSAANVQIQPGLVVTTKAENGKTGEWLIDPTDFTISAGGVEQTGSGIGATTLQNNLATTSVEIQTVATGSERGNINVDADVQWAENKLTLTAHGDILINSTLTAAGSAELALNHGWNGNAASPTYGNNNSHLIVHGRVDLSKTSANTLAINGENHTILRNQSEVASMSSGLNGRYVLGGNLDFSSSWTPIGTFTGRFDGLGNQIHDLVVNHNASGAGLFGNTNGAALSNLRLVGVRVANSAAGVGALVGNATNTSVNNIHASGEVVSTRPSSGTGSGAADAGGLIGFSVGSSVSFSSADVAVSAISRNVGGLVGDATNHSSSGSVSIIRNSFALGNVETSGRQGNVGGLVGALRSASSISNSYATGNVAGQLNDTGNTGIGGLVGEIRTTPYSTISNSYATGTVTTTGTGDPKGGLVGANLQNDGSNVTDSYWVNGLSTSAGGTQITSNETNASSYGFSDFGSNWVMLEGYATPFLKAQGSDALMLNGNLTITQNDNLILNQNINTVSILGSSTLTLKSQNDIVLNPGISIRSSGGKLNTVLWADSDGNEVGGVLFNPNAAVLTNGGHLWMGGGSGSATWNGLSVGDSYAAFLNTPATLNPVITERYSGINILGSTISTGGGDLYMSGKSAQTDYRFGIGVRFNAGAGTSNTITANNITIHGIGSANAATDGDTNRGNWGVGIENTTMNATGDITINGQGGGQSAGSNGGQNHGIRMDANSHLTASGAGNITLIGSGGGNASNTENTDNDGIRLDGGKLTTASGEITLQGTAGLHGSSEGVNLNSGNVNNLIQSTGGGDITIIADTLTISSNQRIASTGHLVVKPLSTSTGIGIGGAAGSLQLASSYLDTNFVNGFSNIIIGSETAGNITVGGSTTYHDNLTLKTAGDITMNASSSLTGALVEDASLVFWADADGSGAGSIYLMNGSSITTNGGHLWMGGGAGTESWNGLTVGDGYARGGTSQLINSGNYKNGISLFKSTINSSTGNILLSGKSVDTVTAGLNGSNGILLEQSAINSTTGNIDISAIAQNTNANTSWNYGLLMSTNASGVNETAITSTSGLITIDAQTSFQKNTHGAALGLYSFSNADSTVKIQSVSGDINLTGNLSSTGFDGQYGGIYLFGSGKEMIVSQSGNISLTGSSANSNVAGINVHPGNTTSYIGYDGINAYSGNITLNSNTKISFEGAIVANTLNLLGAGVDYTLESTQNNINTLIADTGSVSFTNSGALELGDITTSGKMDIATQTGNLTINGNLASDSTAADAIILNAGRSVAAGTASGGNIIVTSGKTLTVGDGGRGTLFTGSIIGSTGLTNFVGSGSGRFRYNAEESTDFAAGSWTNLGTGIYAIYREQPTISVTPQNQTITYGNSDPTSYTASYNGFVNGDTDAAITGTATWSTAAGTTSISGNRIVGAYDVAYNSGLLSGLGYGFADATSSTNELTVQQLALTVTGLAAENKVYDATTTANLSGTAAVDAITGDVVTLDGNVAGEFDDKNVGEGKAITVSGLTLTGDDAANYTLILPADLAANITKANLTVTGLTAENKVYDATTTANLSGTAAVAALSNDSVTLDGNVAGEFDDKNVGEGKAITVSGLSLTGADARNYTLVVPTNLAANITKANLTVTGLTAENKVYDATTTANLSGTAAVDAITGDVVTLDGSAAGAFADKNVGDGKAITVSGLTLNGDDAANYTLVVPDNLAAKITPRPITVTADAKQKQIGQADPALTYQVETQSEGRGLVAGDLLEGDLKRETGEIPAIYLIGQGTITRDRNPNYAIDYVTAELTITRPPQNDQLSLNENTVNQIVQDPTPQGLGADLSNIAMVQDNRGGFIEAPIEVTPTVAEPTVAEPTAADPVTTLSVGGDTTSVRFVSEGTSRTLEIGGGEATELVSQSSLPVYNSNGGQMTLREVVSVQDRGSNISTETTVETVVTPMPNITNLVLTQQTPAAVQNADGSTTEVNVGVTEEDILVIEVPEDLELTSDDQLTLVGLAAAKRMGVSVDRLKDVVIARR